MKTKLVYLGDLKFNLKIWKKELKFHLKELHKFEKQLENIALRNLGIEAMAPLEGLQNKIINEKEVIGTILQRIRMKRRIIDLSNVNGEIDEDLKNRQTSLRDDMKIYIKLHYELKEDLMDYFLRWL